MALFERARSSAGTGGNESGSSTNEKSWWAYVAVAVVVVLVLQVASSLVGPLLGPATHVGVAVFLAIAAGVPVAYFIIRSCQSWLYKASKPEDGTDNTDASAEVRSGLFLHVDHGTGVHYLSDCRGGLTPRLGSDGRVFVDHSCNDQETT